MLFAVMATASCMGDDRTLLDAAVQQCRSNGGVPYGSSVDDLVCLSAVPSDAQTFGDAALDTDHSPLCSVPRQAPGGCVVAAGSISIFASG